VATGNTNLDLNSKDLRLLAASRVGCRELKLRSPTRLGDLYRSAHRVIMESWFADAKEIATLDAEICFLLQDDFYFGPDSYPEVAERKEVEPLPAPNITRHVPSMVRCAEAVGHEEELANYYREVVRLARKHRKTFNDIRQYFWMRFWLWNSQEEVHISFPWYDTFSEIDQFIGSISNKTEGQIFWDADQGWELEMHASDGDFFVRLRNPDDDETYAVVRFSQRLLIEQLEPLRARTESIIGVLASAIGQDVWTSYVEWPSFFPPEATETKPSQPWWKPWNGRASLWPLKSSSTYVYRRNK